MSRAPTNLFDLYLAPAFFDAKACAELIAELAASPQGPATVYGLAAGGAVDERVRKVARVTPSAQTMDKVRQQLMAAAPAVGAHFGLTLRTCEEPQFLRYEVGSFFVAHQDGNTGLLRSEAEQARKASVVIFLNPQSDDEAPGSFAGGSLLFTEWRADRTRGQYSWDAQTGTLVAFTPETTHEVTPVTRGERYSIASWYR